MRTADSEPESFLHGAPGRKSADGLLDRFEIAANDRMAAELRRDGHSFQQIAEAMGCSTSTAHARVTRALRAVVQEPARDLRVLELARYDRLLASAYEVVDGLKSCPHCGHESSVPRYSTPDRLAAMNAALRISERRARLEGLDAPTKMEHRVADSLDAQIVALASELAALEGLDHA